MRKFAISVAVAAFVAGCADEEVILSGERLDLDGSAIEAGTVNRAAPLALPAASVNGDWTHTAGNPAHQLSHVALDRELSLAWRADIGEGNSRKHRITADPVVAGGRVFVMDSAARVTALTTAGAPVWSREMRPAAERGDAISGGGLAVVGGTLFVTTGFGELSAVSAASGEVLWRQDLDALPSGPPTAVDGVVYLSTRNSIGWAVDAANGRILWQVLGSNSPSGLADGAAPAIAGPLVVFPFDSGQMIAVTRATGQTAWVASVAGQRLGRAFSRYSALSSDPVVFGNTIYAGNHSGRAGAFDAASGGGYWQADEGALSPLWVAGGAVFLVSDENRLVRLDAATGETVWAVDLPFFERERIKRRKSVYAHYGPVLASGRLIVVSNDGWIREFSPETGALVGAQELPGDVARNPVVAGGTLYLVTEKGELQAFR